jgi:hypothetical protein
MSNNSINNSCALQYRYSKGFDSCLYIDGESLRVTLLMCTISILGLLIILFLILITAKKLLPTLIKEKHGTVHTFLAKSDFVEDHNTQVSDKSYLYSSKESHRSFNNNVSQLRFQ